MEVNILSSFNEQIRKIIWSWLLMKKSFYVSPIDSTYTNYHWKIGDLNSVQSLRYVNQQDEKIPINKDEVNFKKDFYELDFLSTQVHWKKVGIAFDETLLIQDGKELLYYCLNQLSSEHKAIFLSVCTRFLKNENMIEWLKEDRESFNLFVTTAPKAFITAPSHETVLKTLNIFNKLNKDIPENSYSKMLYQFLLTRKKLLIRLEAQTIISQFVSTNIAVKDREKFFKLMPKLKNAPTFYVVRGKEIVLHISKSLFYQKMNQGGQAIDKYRVTVFLSDLIKYLRFKEKDRLHLEEAHLINADGAEKNYIILLQTKYDILKIDYKELIEKVCIDTASVIVTGQNRQEVFQKAIGYYLLKKSLPEKNDKNIINKNSNKI